MLVFLYVYYIYICIYYIENTCSHIKQTIFCRKTHFKLNKNISVFLFLIILTDHLIYYSSLQAKEKETKNER